MTGKTGQEKSFFIVTMPINKHTRMMKFSSVQFSSVAQSCSAFCDPMNCSTPGLPVHHQLPEFTQTHIHRVSDAIQPSHPLSSPSPPAPIPPSIRVFSNESTLHMPTKVCLVKAMVFPVVMYGCEIGL